MTVSERELTFTFGICYRPSVCLSSVTFVRTTQAVQSFGNISTALGTLASQGNPSAGGVKHEGQPSIAISDLSTDISRKRCKKIRGKLVLMTNRKSYISFRLVPKSVTLNNLERRNGRYFALFQRIRVASGRTA